MLTLQHNSEAIVDRIRLQDRVELFCKMGTRWVGATPLYEQAGLPFKSTFTKNGCELLSSSSNYDTGNHVKDWCSDNILNRSLYNEETFAKVENDSWDKEPAC